MQRDVTEEWNSQFTAAKASEPAQAENTSTEFIEIRYRIMKHSVICISKSKLKADLINLIENRC
jgi:hypothetical protein